METIAADLENVRRSSLRVMASVAALDEASLRASSLLPGWTRACRGEGGVGEIDTDTGPDDSADAVIAGSGWQLPAWLSGRGDHGLEVGGRVDTLPALTPYGWAHRRRRVLMCWAFRVRLCALQGPVV